MCFSATQHCIREMLSSEQSDYADGRLHHLADRESIRLDRLMAIESIRRTNFFELVRRQNFAVLEWPEYATLSAQALFDEKVGGARTFRRKVQRFLRAAPIRFEREFAALAIHKDLKALHKGTRKNQRRRHFRIANAAFHFRELHDFLSRWVMPMHTFVRALPMHRLEQQRSEHVPLALAA